MTNNESPFARLYRVQRADEAKDERVVVDYAVLEKLLEDLRKFYLRFHDHVKDLNDTLHLISATRVTLDEWVNPALNEEPNPACCDVCPMFSDTCNAWILIIHAINHLNSSIEDLTQDIGEVEYIILSAPGGYIGSTALGGET